METLQLGGNITLSGFTNLKPGQFTIIKKIVGTYIKKIGEENNKLNLTLKEIHKREKNQKYELKGILNNNGNKKQAEITDYNLFFALNKILNKLKQ